MSARRTSSGFTLPELLIVLGIVGALLGILLPVVSRARRAANTVKCLANLRSVGQSLQIYQSNNAGWIYPVQKDAFGVIGLGLNVAPHERWPTRVFDLPGAPPSPPYDAKAYRMDAAGDPAYDPTAYTPPVLLCPADDSPAQAHTYVLNNHLADEGIRAGRLVRGVSSSDIVVAGEKKTRQADYYMEFGDYDRVVEPHRHGSPAGSDYLYLDGHAATRPPNEALRGIDPWDPVKR